MSREITVDFDKLLCFIKDYNLKNIASDELFLPVLSKVHKKYFALLILLVEFNGQEFQGGLFKNNADCKNYLFESLSDLGSSFFIAFNGGYKASKLMLRSSIETFIKGISVDLIPNIILEKRIYKIFEDASGLGLFSKEPLVSELNKLKQQYSDLCQDTHTASKSNMQHISALNYFPKKDIVIFEKLANIFVSLVQAYIFIIVIKFNEEFHKIHHKNKSIIIYAIRKSYRPLVLNIK